MAMLMQWTHDACTNQPEHNSSPENICRTDIVVVTHNRNDKLRNLLNSIVKESVCGTLVCSIIIVDDSDLKYDESNIPSDISIQYVHLPKRAFISAAKNTGSMLCQSEYILFVDDDNVLTYDSVYHLVELMDNDKTLGAIMPSVSYLGEPNRIWVYAAPFRKNRWAMNLVGRNIIEYEKPDSDLLDTDALPNAFIIRKTVLDLVGGFDENLPVNSSCDLCQRVKAMGYRVCASTHSRFYHDVVLNVPGYWAGHAASDLERSFYESHDWVVLMRKLHSGGSIDTAALLLHYVTWVSQVILGLILLKVKFRVLFRTLDAFARGFKSGISNSTWHS